MPNPPPSASPTKPTDYLPSEAPTAGSPPAGSPPGGSAGGSASGGGTPDPLSRGQRTQREVGDRLVAQKDYDAKHAGRPPADIPRPDDPAPGYVLLAAVGAGTYGSVWKAHRADDPAREVAVKFFPRRAGGSPAAALVAEVRKLAALTSEQGFVQLLDVNAAGEWPFYVMTYAPRSLADLIAERGPLPAAEAVGLFEGVVRAMALAHAKKPGLCHCDLKPSNVQLTADGRPLVSDFGQARLLDEGEAVALGTFFYMPPEQADQGNDLPDARWDVYALGAVLYAMLAPDRQPPGKGGWADGSDHRTRNQAARLKQYREYLLKKALPADPRRLPGADRRLADLLTRCLHPDPDRRYRDAGEVQAALEERAKARRRVPILAVGAVATLAALAGAVGVGLWVRADAVGRTRAAQLAQTRVFQRDLGHVAAELLEQQFARRAEFLRRAAGRAKEAGVTEELADAVRTYREKRAVPVDTLWLADTRRTTADWVMALTREAEGQNVFARRGLSVTLHVDGFGYNFAMTKRGPLPAGPLAAVVGSAGGGAAPAGAAGGWLADNPWADPGTLGLYARNWSWRDWFCGRGRLDEEKEKDRPHPPVAGTHISVVYPSKRDKRWIIDITHPLAHPAPGQPPVGVLTGGTDMAGELTGWLRRVEQEAAGGRAAGDIGTRLVVLDDRLRLVWRKELTDVLEQRAGDGLPAELDRAYALPTPPSDDREANWHDPEAAGDGPNRLATGTPFHPLGPGRPPWHVVVAADPQKVLDPVSRLSDRMTATGLYAAAGFVALAAALWYGVWRAVRRL